MDLRSHAWMRSWWIGAAAAGLLGPGLLIGQVDEPAAKPSPRRIGKSTRSATPKLLPPATGPVRQIAYDQELAQSEVEQRLRELYERDGREMPDMSMTPSMAPAATAQQPLPVGPPPKGAPRALPVSQPRTASTSQPMPAAKPEGKVTTFFKKLIPGGNKKAQAQKSPAPPRPLPNATAQQPVIQPNYNKQYSAPQVGQPQSGQPRTVFAPAQTAPVQAAPVSIQPNIALPPSPPAEDEGDDDDLDDLMELEQDAPPQMIETEEPIALPAPAEQIEAPPVFEEEPAMPADDDEIFELPEVPAPRQTPAPGFDEDFPDPFGAQPVAPSAPAEPTEPAAPTESAEDENPFSGMTLEDEPVPPSPADAPATLMEDDDEEDDDDAESKMIIELPSKDVSAKDTPADKAENESIATAMRRIIQRTDVKGLKGFCPVTLRDRRELSDSKPNFVAAYRGQKFYFASQVAQAKFETDPGRYAPAAYGADVVVLVDDQDVIEGTLDYAAWYKGRLFLFGSQENHDKFVENPDKYASPPGIE